MQQYPNVLLLELVSLQKSALAADEPGGFAGGSGKWELFAPAAGGGVITGEGGSWDNETACITTMAIQNNPNLSLMVIILGFDFESRSQCDALGIRLDVRRAVSKSSLRHKKRVDSVRLEEKKPFQAVKYSLQG